MDEESEQCEYLFSGFRLDLSQRKLFDSNGNDLNLTSRAFDTLFVLIKNKGETLSKPYLMKSVWPTVVVEENNLNQAVSCLRKALGDSKSKSQFIQTVPGRGYRFIAELDDPIVHDSKLSASLDNATHSINEKTKSNGSPIPLPASAEAEPRQYTQALIAACLLIILVTGSTFYFNRTAEEAGTQASINRPLTESVAQSASSNERTPIPNSIAVLPFSSLNPESHNSFFTIGLHDEMITQLSKIHSLNVISRNTVMALSSDDPNEVDSLSLFDMLEKHIHVESVMTGTVLFAEDQARVNLQLINPSTGVTLWSATYNANTNDLSEMISIQSDIAQNVALALEAEINTYEQVSLSEIPTQSFEAYRYQLAGKNAYYAQDFSKAWTLSKQAILLDPNYIDALDLFSYTNAVLTAVPLEGMSSHAHTQLALDSAERVIELAPEESQGYGLKATALAINKEWGQIAAIMDTLIEQGVPLSEMKFYSLIALCLGDFDSAVEILNASLITDPVDLYGRGFLLSALELSGERVESRREYLIGDELSPRWWGDTINIFLSLGRSEALQDVDDILGLSEDIISMLENIDDIEMTRLAILNYADKEAKVSSETVYYSAAAAHIGENDLAVQLIDLALAENWLNLHWYWLPLFDDIRKLDSFKQILFDAGLVAYWEQYGWPEVCQPNDESFDCDWQAYP